MLYQLKITNTAKKEISRLPDPVRDEVRQAIRELKVSPRPLGSEPLLRELRGRHKLKVDGYRIIYSIKEDDQMVVILTIRPRTRRTYLNVP